MGRSSGFGTLLRLAAREAARQERNHRSRLVQAEREQRNALRWAEQRRKELAQNLKQADREQKQQYLQARKNEVHEKNREIALILSELKSTLPNTFDIDDTIHFDDLRIRETPHQFEVPAVWAQPLQAPNREIYLAQVRPLSRWQKLVPGATKRYEDNLQRVAMSYNSAVTLWKAEEQARVQNLARSRTQHDKAMATFLSKVKERDDYIDEFAANYQRGQTEAVEEYCRLVLERSDYPDSFPRLFTLSYVPASRQLVVELILPDVSIVPTVAEYSYVQKTDEIREKLRKPAEIKALYQDLIASIALRTVHEMMEADQADNIDVVCVNGHVEALNCSNGRHEKKCLVSVQTTKNDFMSINLRYVDRSICLRNLGAQVSRDPDEAVAVKPIVEYNMVDRRFVEQGDLLSDLDDAVNLMDLDPFQFEHLVANLFGKMGLETKLTQSSRDGGVDCIAFDTRPIVGGKIVIQAKRYKNTVGVSAVRDLYGTMLNEGASKGLLVCTSGYGPDAFSFAKDKPIELIDGGALLYMLKDVGVRARIVFPNE